MTKICPFTGLEVECLSDMFTKGLGNRFLHGEVEIAVSRSAGILLEGGIPSAEVEALYVTRLVAAKALIRSKFWRATRSGGRSLFVTTRDHLEQIRASPETQNPSLMSHYTLVAIEDAAEEATQLSFTSKCLNTLENLHDEWRRTGAVPFIACAAMDDKQQSWYQSQSAGKEDGMAYGCDERSAPMVFQWLQEQGFLGDRIAAGQWLQRPQEVKTGPKVQRSARVWVMLDLLLTSSTLTEALIKTKERESSTITYLITPSTSNRLGPMSRAP